MAAKDADLARDFSLDFVYISMPTVADMEIELAATPLMSDGDRTEELYLVGLPIGSSVVYRMRGFDQNGAVNDFVSWDAPSEDPTALQYTGSAGPVINIRLIEVIGGE